MTIEVTTIEATNLSDAWAGGFLALMREGVSELSPLLITVSFGEEAERREIRDALDGALRNLEMKSCHTVANTLFPDNLWDRNRPRADLYQRYLRILPRTRRQPGNRYGTYFERMVQYETARGTSNQLEHIIETYNGGNHRRSAFQVSIFDPGRDHTHQRRRGFPCLQQVAFLPRGTAGLAVAGVYAVQYVFDRAYGNYLGLHRLGNFMAKEMGRQLVQLICLAWTAELGNCSKRQLRQLADEVQQMTSTQPPKAA